MMQRFRILANLQGQIDQRGDYTDRAGDLPYRSHGIPVHGFVTLGLVIKLFTVNMPASSVPGGSGRRRVSRRA